MLVQERAIRSGVDPIEFALAEDEDLSLSAVGQDEEDVPLHAEVLEEQGLAEPPDQIGSSGHDIVVAVVPRDRTEVEVRVLVCLASGHRSAQEGCDDPPVGGTRFHETVDDDSVIAWRSRFRGAHPSEPLRSGTSAPGDRVVAMPVIDEARDAFGRALLDHQESEPGQSSCSRAMTDPSDLRICSPRTSSSITMRGRGGNRWPSPARGGRCWISVQARAVTPCTCSSSDIA